LLCQLTGVSRSGYYKWLKRSRTLTDADIEELKLKDKISECYMKSRCTYGLPRIKLWLRARGIIVNHKRIYRLMKELNIRAIIRRKRKKLPKVPEAIIAENILNRDFAASAPNQKWVADVTQLRFGWKPLYLCTILDLFNNEVVAYTVGNQNSAEFVIGTFKHAIAGKKIEKLIFHSDRGANFTSKRFQETLLEYGIEPSMSRTGNCWDNACIESFFSHLKAETFYLENLQTEAEIRKAISRYIHWYNNERIQLRLGSSPVAYPRRNAA
jgi:transposase InsO family protein